MNWELYTTRHPGVGTLCEVYVEPSKKLIKRHFKPHAVTVSNLLTRFTEPEIDSFFKNEIYWLHQLKSEWLPELVDICEEERFIVQKYYGESLLDMKPRLKENIPTVVDQVLEMYRFFKASKVFKRNGSLSNLTLNNGKIIAFDFKWAQTRPLGLEKELYSYDHYLVKIDAHLPQLLRELI